MAGKKNRNKEKHNNRYEISRFFITTFTCK